MRFAHATAAIIASAFVMSSAQASLTAEWYLQPPGPATPAGYKTLDLVISYDTGDWASAGLNFSLPGGATFYNEPLFGSNTRPNPALFVLAPALEYDSYVTGPADTGVSGAPSIVSGYPSGATSVAQGSVISVFWRDSEMSPPGTYTIARVTYTDSVHGISVHGEITTAGPGGETIFAPNILLTPPPPPPEPASLGLVTLIVTSVVARPRKRAR